MRGKLTSVQARRFAAMILQAADELDRLAEVEVFSSAQTKDFWGPTPLTVIPASRRR
jgi:hypothetical protein